MEKMFNYERVYHDIKEKILSGAYRPEDKLPTEAELQESFGVSRITIKKAMELLASEKLIVRFPKRGTFVNSDRLDVPVEECEPAVQRVIGVLMSGFSPSFGQDFLYSVAVEANRKGYALLTGLGYSSVEEESELIDRMIKAGADGLIIMAVHGESGINAGIANCAMSGFPTVLVDRYLEGFSLPYVGSDNVDAAFQATQYLFSLGHKKIGLISSAPTTTAIVEREKGYMNAYAMTHFRISTSFLVHEIRSSMPGKNTQENFRHDVERMKAYYRDNPDVTALLCIDYNILKVCEAAAQEIGIRIPDDISMVCFDAPDDLSEYTHIRQSEREIGECAVGLLTEVMDQNCEAQQILLPTKLCIGSSTQKIER